MSSAAASLVEAAERLRERTARLRFGPPVAYVYRPLEYAWPVARAYLERFGRGHKEVVLVGMNPGPFGMAQTGVPFGEVAIVRDWMGLTGEIARPKAEHPKRPVQGLACPRSEVSGRRLWGAIAARYPQPRGFFERAFVLNYCPLLFLSDTGANVTPDKLRAAERERIEAICDEHLAEALEALSPDVVVGVGAYATKKLAAIGCPSRLATIPHPSPASPTANRGWAEAAMRALREAGIEGLLADGG